MNKVVLAAATALALVSGPTGLFFAWRSLKPYKREIEAAEARGD